jgi:RND family efflux transporter MFP subunit
MEHNKQSRWHSLWVFPPILVGIAIFIFMVSGKQAPQKSDRGEPTRFVRVITVQARDFIPLAEGYGSVQPAQVWAAVAQVSGRIIAMHPRLRDGEIITAETRLFQIDPADYDLNLAKAQTELAELNAQGENSAASLKIEQRNLALAEKEFKRQEKLAGQGTVSRSRADEAERAMLSSRSLVQNFENTIALLPIQRSLQQAKITQAERDLANTTLTAPFNMRVTGLAIETHQFVSIGQTLLSGDSVERVEIIAQVSMADLRNLFIGQPNIPIDINTITSSLAELTGFKPVVKMDVGNGLIAEWEAEFVRISDSVDPQTRTMGIVVAVDRPMQKIIAGVRPPLSKGMFVQVSIAGRTQPERIVVPRSVIRAGKIYIVNPDNRLETRTVKRLYNQQQVAVIGEGLQSGEKIVVSDLIPAVDGMLLQSVVDETLQQSLSAGE